MASLLLVDLAFRWQRIEVLFADSGYLSKQGIVELYGDSIPWTSLHYHTASSVGLQSLMFLAAMLVATALLVGYRTWLATLFSFILFVSANRRIPGICYGYDDVMRLLLVWSLFLPLGARWSVDRRLGRMKHYVSNRFCSIASAGILLQVCYIYWFTAVWKLHPDWWQGRAIQYAMQIDHAIRPLGQWLATKPQITVPLTFATLFAEFVIPIVALSPWKNSLSRWIAIFTFWSLHLGIWMCTNIGLFPPISMTIWILFIPTTTWDRFARKRDVDNQPTEEPAAKTSFCWPTSRLAGVLAAIILVQITAYNFFGLRQVKQLGLRLPKAVDRLTQLMRIDQQWNLYAPTPKIPDGWFIMPAELADGSTVDIWLNQPVSYEKPDLVSATYRDFRTTMIFLRSRKDPQSPVWPGVARFLVRDWNADKPEQKKVVRLQIIFVSEIEHDGETFLRPAVEYDVKLDRVIPIVPRAPAP